MRAVPEELGVTEDEDGTRPSTDRDLLERILDEVLELRADVQALHRGRQGLDAGRAKAIAAAKANAATIRQHITRFTVEDMKAGLPARGRPARIHRKLDGVLSLSQVRKILRALSSVRDLPG